MFFSVRFSQAPDSKKRQSCPASFLSGIGDRQITGVLSDSTNMQRSCSLREMPTKANKNRYSLPAACSTVTEESEIPSSSQILSQESQISKRFSSISSKGLSASNSQQDSQESFDTDRAASSCPKKTLSTLQKIIVVLGISVLAFLTVLVVKFVILRMAGNQGIYSSSTIDIAIKNKYFEDVLSEKQEKQLENTHKGQQILGGVPKGIIVGDDKDNAMAVVLSGYENNEKETKDTQQIQSQEYQEQIQQLKQLKQQQQHQQQQQQQGWKPEDIIQAEAEQFYNRLVEVTQREKQISYQEFEVFLQDNCTPMYFAKIKAKIQEMVDNSLSVKEELNTVSGARFYLSLEKTY